VKILFGIQATGNGHITRARAMAPALNDLGIEVQYLFSGRNPKDLFDMEVFGDYISKEGLTFHSRKGRVQLGDTLLRNNMFKLTQHVKELNDLVDDYDLVVTDFEPITAWAGKLAYKKVVGLGHQYAFNYKIPQVQGTIVDQFILQNFAPADVSAGLHWHHFGCPILPPIAPVEADQYRPVSGKIMVYLPFESRADITKLLRRFSNYEFVLYHPKSTDYRKKNLSWNKPSRNKFQADLLTCEGVICNAGFELASEALQLGIKLLVKPMDGQPEQQSNALALSQLGYGASMSHLDVDTTAFWLNSETSTKIDYPDTAAAVAKWISDGAAIDISEISKELWAQTELPGGHLQLNS
jgi:uncharacterized protein (TIGR00661 family)